MLKIAQSFIYVYCIYMRVFGKKMFYEEEKMVKNAMQVFGGWFCGIRKDFYF